MNHVADLLLLAKRLELEELTVYCEQLARASEITRDNWFVFYLTIYRYGVESLRPRLVAFLLNNFVAVREDPSMLEVDGQLLREVLADDRLEVMRERMTFEFVWKWLKTKKKTKKTRRKRKKKVDPYELLSLVRLPMMYAYEGVTEDEHEEYADRRMFGGKCGQLLADAYRYKTRPQERWSLQSPRTRARPSTGLQETLIAVGLSPSENKLTIARWSDATKKWYVHSVCHAPVSLSTTIICRSDDATGSFTLFAVDVERGRVFRCRGLECRDWIDTNVEFEPRHGAACLLVGSLLYVIGGDSIQEINLTRTLLTPSHKLSQPVKKPGIIFHDGTFYVIGGFDERAMRNVNCIQTFRPSPSKDRPNEATFPEAGCGMSSICHDGVVYVLANSGQIYQLNLSTLKSTRFHRVSAQCEFASSALYHNKLIICSNDPSHNQTIAVDLNSTDLDARSTTMDYPEGLGDRVHLFSIHLSSQDQTASSYEQQQQQSVPSSPTPTPRSRDLSLSPSPAVRDRHSYEPPVATPTQQDQSSPTSVLPKSKSTDALNPNEDLLRQLDKFSPLRRPMPFIKRQRSVDAPSPNPVIKPTPPPKPKRNFSITKATPTPTSPESEDQRPSVVDAHNAEEAVSIVKNGDQPSPGVRLVKATQFPMILSELDSSRTKKDKLWTRLHSYCWRGDAKMIEELLQTAQDVDAKDAEGRTPLHLAAQNGHEGCVKLMIAAGASRTVENNNQKTPYDVAAEPGIKSMLLE